MCFRVILVLISHPQAPFLKDADVLHGSIHHAQLPVSLSRFADQRSEQRWLVAGAKRANEVVLSATTAVNQKDLLAPGRSKDDLQITSICVANVNAHLDPLGGNV